MFYKQRNLNYQEAKCLTSHTFLEARLSLKPTPPEYHTCIKNTEILLAHGQQQLWLVLQSSLRTFSPLIKVMLLQYRKGFSGCPVPEIILGRREKTATPPGFCWTYQNEAYDKGEWRNVSGTKLSISCLLGPMVGVLTFSIKSRHHLVHRKCQG